MTKPFLGNYPYTQLSNFVIQLECLNLRSFTVKFIAKRLLKSTLLAQGSCYCTDKLNRTSLSLQAHELRPSPSRPFCNSATFKFKLEARAAHCRLLALLPNPIPPRPVAPLDIS